MCLYYKNMIRLQLRASGTDWSAAAKCLYYKNMIRQQLYEWPWLQENDSIWFIFIHKLLLWENDSWSVAALSLYC